MALDIRDFNTMVSSTIDRIKNTTPITNDNVNSVIRNIIESIMVELDINYYQQQKLYNSISIDDATGNDIDRLVSRYGILRNNAMNVYGVATFYVTNANDTDILIPQGTIISTKIDTNGDVIEFETINDATLYTGELAVDVDIVSVEAGYISLSPNTLVVMSTPINGIEGVKNQSSIIGGKDEESDEEFRNRISDALYNYGTATNSSLSSALLNLNTVDSISILDMNRGVGTTDIIVSTTTLPPTQEMMDEIDQAIYDNKAAGIDVLAVYPNIVEINVDITLNTDNSVTISLAKDAIVNYINNLKIAETFIIKQMESNILSSINDNTIDITTNLPVSNIIPGQLEIFKNGTITINGVIV